MFKRAEVILLPKNEKVENLTPVNVSILKTPQKGKLVRHFAGEEFRKYISFGFKPQELYILSDEEIKKDDWVLYHENKISQVLGINIDELKLDRGGVWRSSCKKIIATTDKSLNPELKEDNEENSGFGGYYIWDPLRIGEYIPKYINKNEYINYCFPKPSESFIEKYVEEYNKGNIITDIMVEYEDVGGEEWMGDDYNGEPFWNEIIQLKVNPKDNTITIKKIDLKGEYLLRFIDAFIKEFPETNLEYLKLRAESWIEQNK